MDKFSRLERIGADLAVPVAEILNAISRRSFDTCPEKGHSPFRFGWRGSGGSGVRSWKANRFEEIRVKIMINEENNVILSDPGHHWGPSRSNWKSPPNRDCEKENYVISIDKVGTELAQVRENNRPHCSWIIFEEKVATLDKNEWLKVFFGKKWKRIDSIGRHSGRISGIILQIIPFDSQQSEVERWNIYIFIYIYPMIFKSNEFNCGWRIFERLLFYSLYRMRFTISHLRVALFARYVKWNFVCISDRQTRITRLFL